MKVDEIFTLPQKILNAGLFYFILCVGNGKGYLVNVSQTMKQLSSQVLLLPV